MQIDYQGLATLVAAIAAAVVSIITAIGQLRTHQAVARVERATNGVAGQLVQEAARQAAAVAIAESESAILRRGELPASRLGPLDSGPP